MTKTPTRQRPPYSPESSPFLNEVRRVMRLKHTSRSLVPALQHRLHPVLGQALLLSTSPRQRVADEHVYHAAEAGVYADHARWLLTNLADGLRLDVLFEYVRGLEGDSRHSPYKTFRSSLSAIQTLIMD